jgi:hypothetical protein
VWEVKNDENIGFGVWGRVCRHQRWAGMEVRATPGVVVDQRWAVVEEGTMQHGW